MGKRLDLVGKRFGRLVVMSYAGNNKRKNVLWNCVCDCGEKRVVMGSHLINGSVKSCGCFRREFISKMKTKHGHTIGITSKTYYSWQDMKDRCYNSNNTNYKYYGGRGIKVCERWINSFENFLKDVGEKPNGLTIERINNEGDYTPDNCKWATLTEQANNKRGNRWISHNGQTMTVAQWARYLNIKTGMLRVRLSRQWSIDKALSVPT